MIEFQLSLTMIFDGNTEDFPRDQCKSRLSTVLSVNRSAIELNITPASVRVEVCVLFTNHAFASAALERAQALAASDFEKSLLDLQGYKLQHIDKPLLVRHVVEMFPPASPPTSPRSVDEGIANSLKQAHAQYLISI